MKSPRVAAAACAAALLTVPVLAEDLTIVYKTTGPGGPGTATSYLSASKMRISDADRDTIVEYGPGRIVSIDHKKKEYSEVTLAELEAAMKAAGAQMQAASAQMANMPPAMREKMQQMMSPTASVTKGGTRKVAGYDCQDYDITVGTMMTTRVCATTAIAPPAPNVDYRGMAALAGAAANPMLKNLVDEMKKVQGFTLAESSSMKMMGRSMDSSKEATDVKRAAIPDSTFDVASIAKGYKKVASPTARTGR